MVYVMVYEPLDLPQCSLSGSSKRATWKIPQLAFSPGGLPAMRREWSPRRTGGWSQEWTGLLPTPQIQRGRKWLDQNVKLTIFLPCDYNLPIWSYMPIQWVGETLMKDMRENIMKDSGRWNDDIRSKVFRCHPLPFICTLVLTVMRVNWNHQPVCSFIHDPRWTIVDI